jgi:uncharacterized protein
MGPDEERYSYASRTGVLPISWDEYFAICKGLARAVAPFRPDLILGIIRGGMYPATLLSHLLRYPELYAIRVTSRYQDEIVHDRPVWVVRPPDAVAGKKVLVVDEIAGQGLTLAMATNEVARMGAQEVRSAVMYAHQRGKEVPDYIGIISDELILNPWDREILRDGQFQPHPEYLGAFAQQGLEEPQFLHRIEERPPQKQPADARM